MGRYLFLAIVLIVIAVALVDVAAQLKGSFKLENLSSMFKFQAPSVQNNGTPSVSIGKNTTTSGVSYISRNSAPTSKPVAPVAPAPQPPAGFTVADLSPFYGKIRIGTVYVSSYGTNQVSLTASYGGSPIDVTGWKIKSNRGEILIPQAVADFNPYGFGLDGDIVLGSGGRLDIYSSVSPIGKNLEINECMGYLNNTYQFTPRLQCSSVNMYDRSEISAFSGACQNYIMSLGNCSVPTPDKLNSFSNEPACQSFLQRFNYAGCYNLNRSSSDFFTGRWIVWMPGIWSFDQSHDRVLLLDQNGLLVDERVY